ncbi:MAG: hypothetical protein CMJ64_02920 [Planctomycetaceae bacterium]|nr:hypothetical protein [Planctomycetaceae bacterium]
MASLQIVTGYFHVSFRCAGHRYKRSLKTKSERQALTHNVRIEETIRLVESGRLEVPSDADLATFVLSDAKVLKGNARERNGAVPSPPRSLKSTFNPSDPTQSTAR